MLWSVEAAVGVAFVSDPAGAQDRRLIRGPDGRSSLVVVELTEDEAARVRALAGIAEVYQDEALLWKHVQTPGLESGEYQRAWQENQQAGQAYQRAREEYRRAREEAERRAERRSQGTKIKR